MIELTFAGNVLLCVRLLQAAGWTHSLTGLTDTNLVNFVHHVNSDYLGPLLGPS